MRRFRTPATYAALLGAVFAACMVGDSEWFSGQLGPCTAQGLCTPREMVVNDCIGRARHCTIVKMQSTQAGQQPLDVRSAFEGCLAETSIAMPESQTAACQAAVQAGGDDAAELVDKEVEVLSSFADAPRCGWHLEDCMNTCAAEGENVHDGAWEGTDLWQQPESICLNYGSERASCAQYAASRQRCGGAFDRPKLDDASCMAQCDATYGVWHEDSDEDLCTNEREVQLTQQERQSLDQRIQQRFHRNANAFEVETARLAKLTTGQVNESTVCGYCRSSCRGSRLPDLRLASTDQRTEQRTASSSTPYQTSFTVTDGTARLRVRASARDGVVTVKVRAPGERTAIATCTSTRECTIRPLYEQARQNGEVTRRPRNITTGAWGIEVSTESETPVNFQLVVSTSAATTTTSAQ